MAAAVSSDGVLQDDAGERPRVLGIEVDRARLERPVGHAGAAQADAPLHPRLADRFDHLGRDLGQDVALGERLRAHADHAVVGRARARRRAGAAPRTSGRR